MFLVRAAAAERLAIVATYRTDELTGALRPFLVELGRDSRVSRVVLAPFTREELGEHVAPAEGAWMRALATPASVPASSPRRAAIAAALADGIAYASTTRVGDRTALRLCTVNPRATFADVERALAARASRADALLNRDRRRYRGH